MSLLRGFKAHHINNLILARWRIRKVRQVAKPGSVRGSCQRLNDISTLCAFGALKHSISTIYFYQRCQVRCNAVDFSLSKFAVNDRFKNNHPLCSFEKNFGKLCGKNLLTTKALNGLHKVTQSLMIRFSPKKPNRV